VVLVGAVVVAGLLVLVVVVVVVPAGRRMTVVRLEDDGLDTTVVLPVEPLLKRIAWPGRIVYGAGMPLLAGSYL